MLSNVDVHYAIEELKERVEGARVDKIYHTKDKIRIKLHMAGEGRRDVLILAGKRINEATYYWKAGNPSGFAMQMRKYLSNRPVEKIEQHDFDRIVKIFFPEHVIIAELFPRGKIVFCDKDMEILGATEFEEYKDRSIKRGSKYKFPEAGASISEIDHDRFVDILSEFKDSPIVSIMAKEFNMGGFHSEEICLRASVDKNKEIGSLSDDELIDLHSEMKDLLDSEKSPGIVFKNGEKEDVVPIDYLKYKGLEKDEYDSFNHALDIFYGKEAMKEVQKKKKKSYNKEKNKLEHIIKSQQNAITEFKENVEEYKEIGDLIYEDYQKIEALKNKIQEEKEKNGWEYVEEQIEKGKKENKKAAKAIKNLDPKNNSITISLEKDITIDLDKTMHQNAEKYYQKSKKYKDKIKGAKKAMENKKKELEEIKQKKPEQIEVEDEKEMVKYKRKKRKWYEKFRWFISSDGHLVIGGRDATTNDMLVKKYLQDNDLYAHADIHGAPHVAIKKDENILPEGSEKSDEISDQSLKEACEFAVTYSRAWKKNIGSDNAYWVYPDQVTKEAPSGEFLGKGAFRIKGERNYIKNLPVKAAIGIIEVEDGPKVVGGSLEAIKSWTNNYVILEPGKNKKSDLAKKVKKKLGKPVSLDDIMRSMPPGNGRVVKSPDK